MFEAEADGLRELEKTREVRVPQVLECGIRDGQSFIALERFEFDRPTADTEQQLGHALAALHRHTADQFGWFRDNTIGLTPQRNDWGDSWLEFFRTHRLEFQLQLASENGYADALYGPGQKLSARLPDWFSDYAPRASLLHGDLWSGNWGSVGGNPVIFDPAVYYGDRESDIAMTMLFGGFGRAFYAAYQESWPMAAGHERRISLYQLYHLLNHVNLFGASYLSQTVRLMKSLL